MENQRFKSRVTSRRLDDVIPIWRDREALCGAQKRQSSVGRRDEAVYIADAGKLWTYASYRFCDGLRNPRRREKERKIHGEFRVTRLTCTGGQGTPERGTATWPSRPSSCGNSWSRRSSGTWASHCRSALIISFIIGDLRARYANGHPERLAFARNGSCCGLYLYRGTGNPCAGHIRAGESLTNVRKPRTSSVDGIFGRTLPTGSKNHAVPVFAFFMTCS